MLHDDSNEKIDRFARGIIRRKINQLIGQAGFSEQDRNVFVTTVVERYVANILRNKRAGKRDHRRIGSLHTMVDVGEDEPAELAETISQHELDAQRGRDSHSNQHVTNMARDIAEVMAKLPEELRTLAERLKTDTVSEVARDMGIPRTTLYESIRQLRKRFEDADLKDYL